MATENRLAAYQGTGDLEESILTALARSGKSTARIAPEDLAAVEEFHLGGRPATAELAARMGMEKGMHLLDVGSGIGGAARFFALKYGCRVTGIDMTEEYVRVARNLTARMQIEHVSFCRANALMLPFGARSFDCVCILHVGMNIPDKLALCAELRRVLKPGGTCAVYDVMRFSDKDLEFPLPWANTPESSFVASLEQYHAALRAAGFSIVTERDRREFAVEFLRRMRERVAAEGPDALGPHLLMGADAATKLLNLAAAINQNIVAPVEIVARAM